MRHLFWIILLIAPAAACAQYTFSGHIEYERKVNLHKLWDGDEWMERMKDEVKPFFVSYFNLAFSADASRYVPGREVEAPKMGWGLPPGADNEVQQDFRTGRVTAAKNLYEEHFLIRDSAQKHVWRLTGEVRTIAGYKCRKAVTRICDSVVVVAFYTDEIPVPGGPEQMGGLPGMILELAVPRLFSTWVATKVEVSPVKESELTAPAKGKPLTMPALIAKLQQSLKDWGKTGPRNIWRATL